MINEILADSLTRLVTKVLEAIFFVSIRVSFGVNVWSDAAERIVGNWSKIRL